MSTLDLKDKYPPGFQGFICEISGEKVSAAECLACAEAGAPRCRYGSPAIINGIIQGMRRPHFAMDIAQAQRSDVSLDYGFSATEILGCQRKRVLSSEYPWWEKPSNLFYAFRGNIMHAQAEMYAAANPYAITEDRIFWYLRYSGKTIGLSGAPDLLVYQPHQGGWMIVDYKTIKQVRTELHRHICPYTEEVMSDMPYPVRGKSMYCRHCGAKHPKDEITIVKVPFGPRGSHMEQLQIYFLLVEKNAAALAHSVNTNLPDGLDPVPEDAPVIGAELVYMDMAQVVRAEVDIWPYADRINFLKQKLKAAAVSDLPPVLTDPSQTWQCRYCPVSGYCESLAEAEAVVEAAYEPAETPKEKEARLLKELGF